MAAGPDGGEALMAMEGDTWNRDVDYVAVQRVVSGDWPLPELQEKEQRVAARLMFQAEVSDKEVARRLGISERTVARWREAAADVVG
ncbi:helix-turn-helix domain-containing protein [Streptomyces sp. PA03-1a]|nr:helix-turn-helix domain-containing protein [Streptomyces sp. PA03-1a]MDX2813348.1 helix-turn-helix domain-containing protein [Streptomyces sp. PA03-5A]